jgi:hypothetical protein
MRRVKGWRIAGDGRRGRGGGVEDNTPPISRQRESECVIVMEIPYRGPFAIGVHTLTEPKSG